MYYVTSGLVAVLLRLAKDRDPAPVNVGLATTPAREFGDATALDGDTPVFTHFYFPADNAVSGVFGMDIGTPHTQGRFLSHPDGRLELTMTDDLHEVVFLAVPPWEEVVAFDRNGRRLPLTVVDAEPPEEVVP